MMTSSTVHTDALAVVDAFNAAFGRGDIDAVMAAMTEDCVFESTAPPAGRRYEGQVEVRQAWIDFFATTTDPVFEVEESLVAGDRVVVRWRFTWGGDHPGAVRGVDLFTIVDSKVAEKLAYVKG